MSFLFFVFLKKIKNEIYYMIYLIIELSSNKAPMCNRLWEIIIIDLCLNYIP